MEKEQQYNGVIIRSRLEPSSEDGIAFHFDVLKEGELEFKCLCQVDSVRMLQFDHDIDRAYEYCLQCMHAIYDRSNYRKGQQLSCFVTGYGLRIES